ncbi:MAG TPA: copper oxidase [Polyangiaceae bacterium]|nr:copper oxidase [Polyangiaceae bacterium]
MTRKDLEPLSSPETEPDEGSASGRGTAMSRRELLLRAGTGLAVGALVTPSRADAAPAPPEPAPAEPKTTTAAGAPHYRRPGLPGKDYTPVVVPNGTKLPFKIVDGVKVFHLVAEEVKHEFAPGLEATCWGYNGSVHGPVIELLEGDHARFYVTNRLPAATTVHFHAMLLPNGMDGVGGLTQKAIRPGETFKYEFTIRQHGTGMYHSHHDEMTQMALGLTGMVVIHPRTAEGPKPDRDFALVLHEWKIDPGARRPDPNEMLEFNLLTINGRAFPGTDPLVVKTGQRVRIRIGNLSAMDHHPIHLHGYQFQITETDGGRIPPSARQPETTVLVPVGSTRTIEFVANEPGDWAMHCHMTHHVMNQMAHGIPNLIGVNAAGLDDRARKLLPGYMTMGQRGMGEPMNMAVPPNSIPMVMQRGKHDVITMGGMFTILKVRDRLSGYGDPGWYENPAGTLATNATADELGRDGIDPDHPPGGDGTPKTRFG